MLPQCDLWLLATHLTAPRKRMSGAQPQWHPVPCPLWGYLPAPSCLSHRSCLWPGPGKGELLVLVHHASFSRSWCPPLNLHQECVWGPDQAFARYSPPDAWPRWGNRCVVGGPYDTQHLGLPTSPSSVVVRENSVYNDHTVLCALGPGSEVGVKGLSSPWVTSLAGGCSLPTSWPCVNTEEDPGWGRESGCEAMLPILVPAPSAIASIGGYCSQLCLSLLN